MNKSRPTETSPGINLGDIYFALFRHKWKIIVLAAAGVLSGAIFYKLHPAPYQSEAKLLIRYILDSKSPSPQSDSTSMTDLNGYGDGIMKSEIEILTSFDLAMEVATNIGPEKILAKLGGGDNPLAAANVIKNGLTIDVPVQSSVILLVFQHPDPAIVQPVLQELVADYLDKHTQIHQAPGSTDDFLTEETARLRSQISQTEDEIRAKKTNSAIIFVDEARKSYAAQIARISDELLRAQAELAERQVVLPPAATNTVSLPQTPSDQLEEYQKICARLDFFNRKQDDYLTVQGYTEQNKLVKEVRSEIAKLTKQKSSLEEKNPALASLGASSLNASSSQTAATDGSGGVMFLQSRINVLKQQLMQVQLQAADADEAASKITELERKKEIQQGSYEYFTKNLEQSRIDETLGASRNANMPSIETPTPPFKVHTNNFKTVMLFVFGGIFVGVGWAFLNEFYLDTSIKRSVEVESKLKLPLFLSIPDLARNGHKPSALAVERRQLQNGDPAPAPEKNKLEIVSWETSSVLNPFYDALRDRLVGYFENINLTRKPKLVAVTGTEKKSGVSTIAAGLAASLSETGDGRVLLVDMNIERGAAQQFFQGKPCCLLDDALVSEKRESALVQENLYVVNEGSHTEKLQRVLPKRFASLVPKLKASDYDYIIFDMPSVSQTSVTARLAGLMDMTLLVIESEKTSRDAVFQATALLEQSKARVGAVLNKTRKYVPDRLHRESLGDI